MNLYVLGTGKPETTLLADSGVYNVAFNTFVTGKHIGKSCINYTLKCVMLKHKPQIKTIFHTLFKEYFLS